MSFLGNSQVIIGGGTATDLGIPIEPYYGYTYSQQIYLASEINASGTITGIEFFAVPGTVLDFSDSVTVYIGHTTKSSFDSTSDWVNVASLTQAFVGNVTLTGTTLSITFSTPFVYNGTDNLVIAVEEDRDSYDGDSDEFYCSPTTANRSLRYRDDFINPDPLSPPNGTRLQYIPNIKILGITPSCPTPNNLMLSYLSSDSVALNWTENGVATNWLVEYGPAGFTPGVGTLTTMKPYGINGLSANTDYDFYVRAYCGVGDTSNLAGPYTFTTPCVAVTPALLVDFTSPPTCWDDAQGLLTNNSVLGNFGGSSWGSNFFANSGTNDAAYINLYSDDRLDWLISYPIDLGNGSVDYQLEFDIAFTEYGGTNPAVFDADDTVALVISTDNGITWSKANVIDMWDAANGNTISTTGTHLIYSLSGYTGIVRFGFYAVSTIDDGADNDIFIDNFEIDTAPACPQPSGLLASVSSNGAMLNWTENGSATDWQIEWDTTGFVLGTGTRTGALTSKPYNITGLVNNSTYQFYVRAICGVGDTSSWAGPLTFTTLCNLLPGDSLSNAIAVTSLPYSDTSSTDSCYVSTQGNGTPDVWYTLTTDECSDTLLVSLCNSSFDTYLRIYESDGTTLIDDNDDACGTRSELELVAGVDYTGGDVLYILVEGYPGEAGDYVLDIDENVNPLNLTVNVMMDTAMAADTASTNSYQWLDCDNGDTAITGATMYWYKATTSGNYAVIIDNGTCSDTSACVTIATTGITTNQELGFSVYPNPSNGEFTLTLDNNETMNVEIINTVGQIVYSSTINNTVSKVDLRNVAKGTYVIRIFNDEVSSQDKLVIK